LPKAGKRRHPFVLYDEVEVASVPVAAVAGTIEGAAAGSTMTVLVDVAVRPSVPAAT